MKSFGIRSLRFCFVLILIISTMQNISAQQDQRSNLTVRIDQIISRNFPDLTLYVVVENERGEVVTGLSPSLFSFRINSLEETGRVNITPFSMREPPIDYSIIFSNSGIMIGEPLDFQKNAILQFIETMRPRDTLSLYTVGEEANVIFEGLRRDDIDPSVINGISVTTAQPRLYDSIINVMRRVQRRQTERRVVILMTDGRDQNSRFTREQTEAVLAEVGVPIYAVGMRVLAGQTLNHVHEMANFTGGAYIFAPNASDIPATLRRLNSRITQPYIINLRVRSLRADNLPHIIEVSVNERDATGSGSRTFTAVRVPVPRWARLAIAIGVAVILIAFIVFMIIRRIQKRKRMGITRRRCPDCGNRMKDSWDTCPFCRYMPQLVKKKKAEKKVA